VPVAVSLFQWVTEECTEFSRQESLYASRFAFPHHSFKYLVTFDTDETSKDITLRQNEKPYEKVIEEIKWARS
jgi:hypothetical protein